VFCIFTVYESRFRNLTAWLFHKSSSVRTCLWCLSKLMIGTLKIDSCLKTKGHIYTGLRLCQLSPTVLMNKISEWMNPYWLTDVRTVLCVGCDGRLDIVLVVEASDNIRNERFPRVLDLLSSVVEQFDVAADKTRFGALMYSQTALVQFNLRDYSTKQDVLTAVRRLRFLGGRTRVANALRLMVSSRAILQVILHFYIALGPDRLRRGAE